MKNLRSSFPILERKEKGKPLIYLDSACMSFRPQEVINAIVSYYTKYPACGGRSMHRLSTEVGRRTESARDRIKEFVNGRKKEEIVFTKNTTEAINLVAHSLPLKKGDLVLTTDMEHNSNLVPWQVLKKKKGIIHKTVKTINGKIDFSDLEKKLSPNLKVISMIHVSNVFGTETPARKLAEIADEYGAYFMLDAAQSAPHKKIDVRKLKCDFLAFSGHKMCGPSGTGVLYGGYEKLKELEPFITGGDTVENATEKSHTFLLPPKKFEAGLQNYAGIMGMEAAIIFLEKAGLENIEKHEKKLAEKTHKLLEDVPEIDFITEKGESGGIVTFTVDGFSPHDIAMILSDKENIMVRSGMHCVHSWFNKYKIDEGSVRASFYLYNTEEEAEKFAGALEALVRGFKKKRK